MNRFSAYVLSVLLCVLGGVSRAQTAAPADSLAVVSFKGSHHLGAAYDTSHLKAVYEASAFPKFYRELMPQLLNKALESDPKGAEHLADVLTGFEIAARQGFTAYVRPVAKPANGEPPFAVGVVVDGHEEADALEGLAKKLVESAGGDPKMTLRRTGTALTLTVGEPGSAEKAAGLDASPAFAGAMKQVDANAAALVYLDVERAFSLVDEQTAGMADNPWAKVKPLTGLAGLKRFVATAGFVGPSWSTRTFTEAPAPREKWLALLQGGEPAAVKALMDRVPAEATYVLSGHVDLPGWIDSFRAIAGSLSPDGRQKFDQGLGLVGMYVGRNLVTDVLAPLGTDWVAYSVTPKGGQVPGQPPALVLVGKVANEAKAKDGLVAVTYALANTSQNANIRNAGFAATAGEKEVGGLKVTTLTFARPLPNVGPIAPSWVVKDGFVYFGATAEGVAAAAGFAGPAFPGSAQLADARGRLGRAAVPEGASVEFVDAPATVPQVYPALRTAADMGLGMLNGAGIKATVNPLPPLAVLREHLHPILAASWTDDAGFHSVSTSPFPGAELVAGGGASTVTVGTTALATSILLPSLNRARETANRVKCASNMKQVGSAILLYSNENKGAYPPDLGTLAATQDIGTDVFRCPDTDTKPIKVADDVVAAEKRIEESRKVVNEHADYVFVGQKFNNNTVDADMLVLYEKMEHHTDGCNMLFADGSVEFRLKKEAERVIAAGKR